MDFLGLGDSTCALLKLLMTGLESISQYVLAWYTVNVVPPGLSLSFNFLVYLTSLRSSRVMATYFLFFPAIYVLQW